MKKKGKAKKRHPHFSYDEAAKSVAEFCGTVAALRHPDTGCPWDLQQDHVTLRKFMIEEAYEAAEVMETKSTPDLCDELGDVLLQVVLNAQVAAEQGVFTMTDVARTIDAKMRRRHPHVFDRPGGGKGVSIDEVWAHWKKAKALERAARPKAKQSSSVFEKARKERFPATTQARKIGETAATIKFDWSHPSQVFAQLKSEMDECEGALKTWRKGKVPRPELVDELSDLYFTLAQLCRHVGCDPEATAFAGNQKFLNRFALMEKIAAAKKIDITKMSQAALEDLWKQAKKKSK